MKVVTRRDRCRLLIIATSMKIFVLSPNKDAVLTSELIETLKSIGEVVFCTTPTPLAEVPGLFDSDGEKIVALDPDFCDWKADTETITTIPGLKAVCLQSTSFSWIDTNYLQEKGIPVTNLRGFSTEAVAEWALLMALSLARKIPLVVKGGWNSDFVAYQGVELAGKTAAIIGLGRNGKRIAELAKGIGMNVMAWSHTSSVENVDMVTLSEIFSKADVIFPCVADNIDTKKLITDDLLASMKPTAIFVSTIHLIYNHKLLLDMVKEGKLYGYGFEDDGPNFLKYDGNVWASPQLAWATDGSMEKNGELWAEAIVLAAQGQFPTRIN